MCFWIERRDAQEFKLKSIEIKTEIKDYTIKSNNNGIIGMMNFGQKQLELLESLSAEQLDGLKEKAGEAFNNTVNILNIGDIKMRINTNRASHTLSDESVAKIINYCKNFIDDINVDVRVALTKKPEVLNGNTFKADEDEYSSNKPNNTEGVKAYGGVLILIASIVILYFITSILGR